MFSCLFKTIARPLALSLKPLTGSLRQDIPLRPATPLPSRPARLPDELLYHIMEYIRDDLVALKNCSLTSRTWHAVARRHLLSSINVHHYMSKQHLRSFKQFISDDPSRCSYITAIYFFAESYATDELFVVLKQLTRLRRLGFRRVRILPAIGHDDRDVKLSVHLDELSFVRCRDLKLTNQDADEDPPLSDGFSGIQPLASGHKTVVESCLTCKPPYFWADVDHAFHECIRQRVDLIRLVSMNLALHTPLGGVQRMVCAAQNLKFLSLTADQGEDIGLLSLKTCTSIRSVQLNLSLSKFMLRGHGCHEILTKAASVFNTCPFSSPLLEVRFHIQFVAFACFGALPNALDGLDMVDWRPLACAAKVMKHLAVEIHPDKRHLANKAWDPESCLPDIEDYEEGLQEVLSDTPLTLSWCRGDHEPTNFDY
ncbi:hypothetical protein EIP91_007907 [Steccherinum ochraceum]|uniref:F-box domain-containing protein n=1 Tax=Steccherinum ochraceum TaxID=92696 RepID=A0A4R0RLD1_9APHY|nr:hypothetical protein EIP91_007907 [Steccherinum ochraceum]